jgi:hypothetical protein
VGFSGDLAVARFSRFFRGFERIQRFAKRKISHRPAATGWQVLPASGITIFHLRQTGFLLTDAVKATILRRLAIVWIVHLYLFATSVR